MFLSDLDKVVFSVNLLDVHELVLRVCGCVCEREEREREGKRGKRYKVKNRYN